MTLRRLHRLAGLAAALFVLLLAGTGVLLNHSDDLGLDGVAMRSPALLGLWGLQPPQVEVFQPVAGSSSWLALAGGQIWLGRHSNQPPASVHSSSGLLGAVTLDQNLMVLLPGQLLVLLADGTLADALTPAFGLPRGATAVGTTAGPLARPLAGSGNHSTLVLQTPAGVLQADASLSQWTPLDTASAAGEQITWSSPGPASTDQTRSVQRAASANLLHLERVLLDLHSLRVAGLPGQLVNDLAALAMLFLAGSGLVMSLRRRRPHQMRYRPRQRPAVPIDSHPDHSHRHPPSS